MPRFALYVGQQVRKLGELPGSRGDARRVRVHVYGTVTESLGNNEYTVEWDDPTLGISNHFYHQSRLGCICGVKRTRNDRPIPRAPRGPDTAVDGPDSDSDSSSEDEADEPGDELDREEVIEPSPRRSFFSGRFVSYVTSLFPPSLSPKMLEQMNGITYTALRRAWSSRVCPPRPPRPSRPRCRRRRGDPPF